MQLITPEFLLEMKISGVWTDMTGALKKDSLRIDPELNSGCICEFQLISRAASPIAEPLVGHQVRISDMKDSARVYHFGGLVHNSDKKEVTSETGGTIYAYTVKCQDYTSLLDREKVTLTFVDTRAGDIVKALINALPEKDRLDTSNVDLGPIMNKVVVPSLTPKEALDELNRQVGYKYWVTYDRKLYYKPKGAVLASWDLCAAEKTRIFGKPRIKKERGQYRNVQEVRGAKLVEDKPVYYPPNTQAGVLAGYFWQNGVVSELKWDLGKPINEVLYVHVGSSPDFGQSIAYNAAPRGNNTPFYYDAGSPYVYLAESWVINDKTEYAYDEIMPYGQWRYIWFFARHQTEVRASARKDYLWCQANNEPAIDTIEQMAAIEDSSGIVSKVEVNENLTTVAACQARANQLIKDFGVIATVVEYMSDNWGDLAVGQQQHVDLYGLQKDCIVRSVRIRDIGGHHLRASVTLVGSESPNFGQYWRQIAAGKTPGMQLTYAMRSNEIAAPSVYLRETLHIAESLAISSVAISTFGSMKISTGGEWA